MEHRCCANCLYSSCSTHAKFSGFLTGFGRRVTCSNHPDAGGRLREVRPGGLCRNYRPRPRDQPTGAIRRLNLANGQFVLVDGADYEWLRQYNWTMRSGYATRHENGKVIFMHREIMQAPPGKMVDHKDGCRQNNYRDNLRFCDRTENLRNRPRHMNSHSQFKGVSYFKRCRKWYARIFCEGEHFRSPLLADEADAARFYDRLAVELFGAFAYVNFPDDWPPERRAAVHAQKETVQAIRQRRAARAAKAKSKKAQVKSRKAKGKGKK